MMLLNSDSRRYVHEIGKIKIMSDFFLGQLVETDLPSVLPSASSSMAFRVGEKSKAI